MSIIEQLMEKRIVIGSFNDSVETPITAVVSFYNGAKFVTNRLEEIRNQNSNRFRVLIIDNGSTDNSWELILKHGPSIRNAIMVKNPVNFGGTGTAWFNRDLIDTQWFTSIHQDDSYMAHHLRTFIISFEKIQSDVVAISNDMGRVKTNTLFTSHPPRGIWFQKDNDQVTAFLANLRKHQIPWGATAFRTEVYWKSLGNWHSPTFPDTEMILKMCAHGIFKNTGQETMFYLENPSSESHDLANSEQELGAAISLLRVFNSLEFEMVLEKVSVRDLPNFQIKILNNLDYRFGNSAYLDVLKNSVNDRILRFTEYSDTKILQLSLNQALLSKLEKSSQILANVAGVNISTKSTTPGKLSEPKKSVILYVLGLMPYRIRKMLFKKSVELEIKISGKSNWDFRWKK